MHTRPGWREKNLLGVNAAVGTASVSNSPLCLPGPHGVQSTLAANAKGKQGTCGYLRPLIVAHAAATSSSMGSAQGSLHPARAGQRCSSEAPALSDTFLWGRASHLICLLRGKNVSFMVHLKLMHI